MAAEWTFLLSRNDLEARTLADLAVEAAGGDERAVVELGLAWGGVPTPAGIAETVAKAATPRVALVESPDPRLVRALEAAGREVAVLDHHLVFDAGAGKIQDRRHALSSLEQGARLLDRDLLPWQRLVAANDAAFWPGLMAELKSGGSDWMAGAPAWLGRLAEVAGGLGVPPPARLALAVRLRELACILAGPGGDPDDREGHAAETLRKAIAWLETAEAEGRLRRYSAGLARDHDYWLVRAPGEFEHVLGDALYLSRLRSGEEPSFRYLALFDEKEEQGKGPVRLLFSGHGDDAKIVSRLLKGAAQGACQRLTLYGGGGMGTAYLGASARRPDEAPLLAQLADDILNASLGLAQPLAKWTTRMFQVLDLGDKSPTWSKESPQDFEPYKPDLQEQAYLLGYVRRNLCPPEPDDSFLESSLTLNSFRRKKGLGTPLLAVAFAHNGGNASLRADLREVLVHFGFNGLAILEWSFEGGWAKPPEDGEPLWERLLSEPQPVAEAVATVGRLLDFNNLARQCYSPYQESGNSDPAVICLDWPDGERAELEFLKAIPDDDRVPEGWFHLLARRCLHPFGLGDGCRLLLDDRSRLVSGVALAGARPGTVPEALGRHQAVFARLADVAGAGDGYPYGAAFSRRTLKAIAYRRFEDWSTLFAIDDHALVAHSYGGFGYKHIVGRQIGGVYRRLYLIGLFYQASFHKFSENIIDLAKQAAESGADRPGSLADKVHELRVKFLDFANALWFDDVSPQIQGVDMFRLLAERMRLHAQYREVTAELERFDAVESADADERAKWRSHVLSAWGGLFVGGFQTYDFLNNFFNLTQKGWDDRFQALPVALLGGVLAAMLTQAAFDRSLAGKGLKDRWKSLVGGLSGKP